MTKASPYSPSSLTSAEVRRAAFRCGLELAPDDERAAWIASLPTARSDDLGERLDLYLVAVVAYHEGQAQQFEEESW